MFTNRSSATVCAPRVEPAAGTPAVRIMVTDGSDTAPDAPRPAPVGATAKAHRAAGITIVLTAGRRGYLVMCTCGKMDSRRRWLRGSAVAEAYTHAARYNCIPAQPLIDPHTVFTGEVSHP